MNALLALFLSIAWSADPEPTPTEPAATEPDKPGDAAAPDDATAPETAAETAAETDAETQKTEAPAEPKKPRWPGEPAPGSPHYDLEVLYGERKSAEGLELAQKRLAENPQDPALYWMVVRFMFEYGEAYERDDTSIDKLAHYAAMVEIAEKGLEVAPTDPHIRFAHGIALGRLGTTRGVLASHWSAKTIEGDWLYVADSGLTYSSLDNNEMLPCDAYQALGIFYRLVPDWWIVQVLAGTRGDLDKSLALTRKAVECGPDRIGAMKEYAVTQLCIGKKRRDDALLAGGKETLRALQKLPPGNPTDQIDVAHAALLLADPGIACEYSRDGQQDLDKAKLDAPAANE